MRLPITFICILLLILACTKKIVPSTSGGKLLQMDKSPCFGYCPVYQLTVFDNGLLSLHAQQNLKDPGTYRYQMTKSELKQFKAQLAKLNLSTYKDEYREPIADAPSTTLTYYSDPIKKIYTNFQYPDLLQKFTDSLDHMVINSSWEKFIDLRQKKEFIIHLKEGKTISGVLQRFSEYDLMLGKRLDPASSQLWMVTAQVLPQDEDGLLKKLKLDVDIKEAQTNKKLETR